MKLLNKPDKPAESFQQTSWVDKKPITEHPAMQLIGRSVAKLNMPPLAPLVGLFVDVKSSVEKERAQVRREMNEAKAEAYAAAARLMATNAPLISNSGGYFGLIESQSGDK